MFSFNGGKDCTVLLHLLRAAIAQLASAADEPRRVELPLKNVRTIYFSEADEFPEVLAFMEQCSLNYGFTVCNLQGSFKDALGELLADEPGVAIFMGQRRIDPHGHKLALVSPSDPDWVRFDRVNPILEWSHRDVWEFLRDFELPYCSLYDQGYTSLGNTRNTWPNPLLYDEESDTYLPAFCLKDETAERAGRQGPPKRRSKRKVAPDPEQSKL